MVLFVEICCFQIIVQITLWILSSHVYNLSIAILNLPKTNHFWSSYKLVISYLKSIIIIIKSFLHIWFVLCCGMSTSIVYLMPVRFFQATFVRTEYVFCKKSVCIWGIIDIFFVFCRESNIFLVLKMCCFNYFSKTYCCYCYYKCLFL